MSARNFSAGGAAINVLAWRAGARVVVVDVGGQEALPADLPIVHPLLLGQPPPRAEFGLASREPELWTPAARQFGDWMRHIAATATGDLGTKQRVMPRVDGQ